MAKRIITFKDPRHEIRLFNKRLIEIAILTAALLIILLFRLLWMQIFQHKLYVTLSEQNRFELAPLEPNRGLIFDRNGVLLAENIPAFSLNIIPEKVNNLNNTLSELQKIIAINPDDLRLFHKQLKQRHRAELIPLRMRLTENELALFAVNQYRFPGVVIKAQLIRRYPLGPAMVSAVGYIGRINEKELNEVDENNYQATNYIGKLGIEKFYEQQLHGTVGYEQVEADVSGHVVRVLKRMPPKNGDNLYLTIDSNLQTIAINALKNQRGAVVAIDPNNGQILALVSNPSYDPNLFVNGIRAEEFKMLRDSPDQPLYNRALRGQYPPGSTVKPFIALAGLETNVISPNFTIFDPGWFKLENSSHIYHDWRRTGHGWVNPHSAIMSSCDTFFFTLGLKLGIENIHKILTQFGFGKATSIDSLEESPGNLPSPAWKKRTHGKSWYPGDTLITTIGQGYMLATPLQLASSVATLSMLGQGFQPQLLLRQQRSDGSIQSQTPVSLPPVTLKDKTWELVHNAMFDVVNNPSGTAYRVSQNIKYEMAGKTGTAQVFSLKQNQKYNSNLLPERLRDHSLFIAFAPFQQPKIAIAVIVENSDHTAANIARQVIDYYLINKDTNQKTTNDQ